MSKTVGCKECTYVQKDINGKYEKIDPKEDIEQTFSNHILLKTCFYCGNYWSKVKLNRIG